jgi:RNA-directed DNA polymerase
MKLPNDYLTETWEKLDFNKIRERLFETQRMITRLTLDDRTKERIELQEWLTNNLDFRCLAVDHVANTSDSPGVDNVMWRTSAEKMQAAYELVPDTFRASPLRIWKAKQKNNGKMRRYAIPTFHDRAMCVLQGYSLLPVIEVYGDKASFCCRKGRSRYDAQAYVLEAFKGADAPRYVVTTDVKSYYSSISHGWLMQYVPMNKHVLSELLHANIIEAGEMFSRDGIGISEGCNLSPYIGNFVLDGLQSHIYQGLNVKVDFEEENIDYANGHMIRYADDILVSVRSPEYGLRVLQLIDQFVKVRGLELKEEKTSILCVEDGFDYLKFHFVKKDRIIKSSPSEQSIERIKADLCDVVGLNIKNQRNLIKALNPKLRAWGNTYKFCESNIAFQEVDDYLQNILFDAVKELHPTFTAAKIYERYWYTDFLGRRYFAVPKQREVCVMHLEDIVHVNYNPVRLTMNPFIDVEYLKERSSVTPEHNVTDQYRPVWERQGGKCYYCGHPFLNDQPIKLITIDPTRPERMENKAYIHSICEQHEYIYHYTLDDLDGMSPKEIDEMLVYASAEKQLKHKLKGEWKYRKLEDYFEKSKRNRFTVSFTRLEKISGYKISDAMRRNKQRWKATSVNNTMPDAWEAEGFKIAVLDLDNEMITFERRISGRAKLEIPKVLLDTEIPVHVKEEIEHYLKTIVRTRGITKNRKNI